MDRFNLIARRFNHQNDIIYRNVVPNICLQFVQICSTFTGNFVPLSETIFMECTNVLSLQTVNKLIEHLNQQFKLLVKGLKITTSRKNNLVAMWRCQGGL